MDYQFFQHNSREELTVFFAGWAMDENPFKFLNDHKQNILIFYNYNDLKIEDEIFPILGHFTEINLIAWSFGVYIANFILGDLNLKMNTAVAINGTLQPVHREFGIPPRIMDYTINHFKDASIDEFYKNMCVEKEQIERFLQTKPHRDPESLLPELKNLNDFSKKNPIKTSIFSSVILSEQDKIIPVKNQRAFWCNKLPIRTVINHHFPFYLWDSWEEIIKYADN